MSKAVLWTVAGIVVVTAAAAAMFLTTRWNTDAPPPVTIGTLDAWVEFSRRPGFELLDTHADEDYFIAVYRTEADELAFCYRWRGEGGKPNTSLAVHDDASHDVQDAARRGEATVLNPAGPLPGGGFVDGMVIPIRADHDGPVHVQFQDDRSEPGAIPRHEVYRKALPWER